MILNELLILSVPAAAATLKLGALVLTVALAARAACPPGTPSGLEHRARAGLAPGSRGQRG